jgi:4-diphosphocytidyl-2-C-methyl-D-erythritol kinase
VPSAAGLGGGSSDAAATLTTLNVAWGAGLEEAALTEVAAEVGSDIPALLAPGGAVARGRGERVERLSVPPFRWALVTFPFGIATGDAFAWWDEWGGATGPDVSEVLGAAMTGDPRLLAPLLSNDLEPVVIRRHPEIRDASERLLDAGALATVLCGSGPTVAGLLDDHTEPPVGTVPVTSGPRSQAPL